jgi:hypothetical protein
MPEIISLHAGFAVGQLGKFLVWLKEHVGGCAFGCDNTQHNSPHNQTPLPSSTDMATSFVPTPREAKVPCLPGHEWVVQVWDRARFTGPHRNLSIVFRDFKPVLGRPGAFFATPVVVAPFRKAVVVAIDGTIDLSEEALRSVRRRDVIVPLGGSKKARVRMALQACTQPPGTPLAPQEECCQHPLSPPRSPLLSLAPTTLPSTSGTHPTPSSDRHP